MKKNNSIELLRIIFTLIVCLYHFGQAIDFNIIPKGYIGVEFFFILSGYLLYDHFKNKKSNTGEEFVVKKIKRLFGDYFLALIIAIIFTMIFEVMNNNKSVITIIIEAIPEVLMIQNIGIYNGGINYPLWYISVFIIAGYFIYTLLITNKNLSLKLIFPLSILLIYSYIFNQRTSIEIWEKNNCFYFPLLRGYADLILGIYAYILKEKIEKYNYIKFYNFLEVSIIFLVFYVIFTENNFDKYMLILIPTMLALFFAQKSFFSRILNWNIFGKLSILSYPIYVNHAIVISGIRIVKNVTHLNDYIITILFLLSLIIYSWMTSTFLKILKKYYVARGANDEKESNT